MNAVGRQPIPPSGISLPFQAYRSPQTENPPRLTFLMRATSRAQAKTRLLEEIVQKSVFIGAAVAVLLISGGVMIRSAEAAPQITVYKNASCGCCHNWVEHLRDEGFEVTAVDVDNLPAIKIANGISAELGSCHTAVIDGHVIEGHVPADAIRRMLKENPELAGLAVPGMPMGSPGMEVPSGEVQPHNVLSIDRQGSTQVYQSIR